jgi:CPA2 family monovalent cation:H+ antiporter-2
VVLVEQPLVVLATFAIIVFGKSAAAYLIVRAFGHPNSVALTISASLAQIGEFSFILVVLGVSLQIVPDTARDLVVAGAILSIIVNPLLFILLDQLAPAGTSVSPAPDIATQVPPREEPTLLTGHAVLVGHGRVGSKVSRELMARSVPLVVVEEDPALIADLKQNGIDAFVGAGGEQSLLDCLNLEKARWMIVAIPDPFEAGHIVEAARLANPSVRIIARAHSAESVDYLHSIGADTVLMGEYEIARGMVRDVLP